MTTANTQIQDQSQETVAEEAPTLTLSDITAVRNIIDVIATRGAFRANELSAVGAVYDKVCAFLNAAQQSQQPAEKE